MAEDIIIKTRPVGQGKDPLAEGHTLYNPSNSEEETEYEVLETSNDVTRAEKEAERMAREYHVKPAAPIPRPVRKVRNKSEEELAEAIKSSKRKGR